MDYLQQFMVLLQHHLHHSADVFHDTPTIMLLFLVLVAAAVTFIPVLWRVTGLVNTVVHESGHAVAALTTFSSLRGVRISKDHSGSTRFISSDSRLIQGWCCLWGYIFPGVVGAGMVVAAISGWGGVALTVTALIAVIIVLQVRNLVALLSVGGVTVSLLTVWWFIPEGFVGVVVFFCGWLVLFGGVRAAFGLLRLHLRGEDDHSDASQLRELFLLPALFWCVFFVLVNTVLFWWAVESSWFFLWGSSELI